MYFVPNFISLQINNTPEGTLFLLEHPLDGRAKWLFAWYAFTFLVPAGFLLYVGYKLSVDIGPELPLLVLVGVAVACIVIGFRYMASAWRKDTLLITREDVILTERKGFHQRQRIFKRTHISDLRFVERPELTPHPLAGKTFDYLGFQVQDQVINEMFGDHRLAFVYEGQPVSFGRKLYSWDFHAILQALSGRSPEPQEELPWNTVPSWETYWETYRAFQASIPAAKHYISEEVEKAKLYVNGLTDGWADHRSALQELLVRYEDQWTVQQRRQLEDLVAFVDEVVRT